MASPLKHIKKSKTNIPKLIESRFVAGPKDSLATVDFYEVSENAPRNRARTTSDGAVAEVLGALRVPFEPEEEVTIEDASDAEDAIEAVKERLAEVGGGDAAAIADVLSAVTINNNDVQTANQSGTFQDGDTEVQLTPESLAIANALKNIVDNIRRTGDPSYEANKNIIDKGAETIVYTALAQRGIDAGLVDSVLDLINASEDKDVRREVGLASVDKILNPKGVKYPSDDKIVNESEGNIYTPEEIIAKQYQTPPQGPNLVSNVSLDESGGNINNGITSGRSEADRLSWGSTNDPGYNALFRKPKGGLNWFQSDSLKVRSNPGVRANVPVNPRLTDLPRQTGIRISLLERLLEFLTVEQILARYPNIISRILRGYRLPLGEFTLENEYNRLINLLNKFDPEWYLVNKTGKKLETEIPPPSDVPGPTSLIAGDEIVGFYGEVNTNDLIAGDALATEIGLLSGIDQNSNEPWLKVSYEGEVLFIAKKPFKHSVSWRSIYQAGAVYGTDDDGKYPSGGKVKQDARVVINNRYYKVRLLSTSNTDPAGLPDTQPGVLELIDFPPVWNSEWNRIIYALHDDTPASQTGNNIASYTDEDLVLRPEFGDGSKTWCQETKDMIGNTYLQRGNEGVDKIEYAIPTDAGADMGWRPVLVPTNELADNDPSGTVIDTTGEVTALSPFFRASLDSVFLLTAFTDSEFMVEALIAKSYVRTDTAKLLRAQFPLLRV